jgi:hypothetical protein
MSYQSPTSGLRASSWVFEMKVINMPVRVSSRQVLALITAQLCAVEKLNLWLGISTMAFVDHQ